MLFIWAVFSLLPVSSQAGKEAVTYALFSRGWPPIEISAEGAVSGVAVDVFREVMPKGMVTKVESIPRARVVLDSSSRPVYTRLEAKEWFSHPEEFWWSQPVLKLRSVLYSPSGVPFKYTGLKSLEGKTIGCIRNYDYPRLDQLFDSGRAVRYDVNRDHLLLRMVKSGRVDVAVMDAATARWMIRERDEFRSESFYVAEKPLAVVDLRFAFNKVPGWDRHLPEINRRIRALHDSGRLSRILENYE